MRKYDLSKLNEKEKYLLQTKLEKAGINENTTTEDAEKITKKIFEDKSLMQLLSKINIEMKEE